MRARHRYSMPAKATCAVIAFFLFVVPPRYIVGVSGFALPLTAWLGLACGLSWTLASLSGRTRRGLRRSPVDWIALAYLSGCAFSLGIAFSRPLADAEMSGALRGIATAFAYVGLALFLSDSLRSALDIGRMLDWLLVGSYFSAVIALCQKAFEFQYTAAWSNLPFLRSETQLAHPGALLDGRAMGTSSHPIELSVVCGCLLGLAAHQAFSGRKAMRQLHAAGAFLLVAGCLLAASRSGLIAGAVVAVFTLSILSPSQRVNALAAGVCSAVCVQALSPLSLSSLRYAILNTGTDLSSQGRTSDYTPAFAIIDQHPVTGLGLGTFTPEAYFILDNSWLGTLLTGGVVGVALLAGLYSVVVASAYKVRRAARDAYLSGVAGALGAAMLALAVSAFFFDELNFPQASGLLFVLIGISGACYRAGILDKSYSSRSRTPSGSFTAAASSA